jgi:hypothetical protein
LYLGFAESWGFGNPNLRPGFYSDNGGALTVTVQGQTATKAMNVAPSTSSPEGAQVIPTYPSAPVDPLGLETIQHDRKASSPRTGS